MRGLGLVTRVKVCCVQNVEEGELAVRAGASAIGLVAAMPSGPGPIHENRIRQVADWAPPGVSTFLLTSETEPDRIARQHGRCGTQVIQLVDMVSGEAHRELRALLPGVRLVQVIHVSGPESLEEAKDAAVGVHALLLDSGKPHAKVRELGGTGRIHDWDVSARIRDEADVPVYLAGGLTADNVSEAIRRVRPFGVDLCTGVRTEGRLSPSKLRAFMQAVRLADL